MQDAHPHVSAVQSGLHCGMGSSVIHTGGQGSLTRSQALLARADFSHSKFRSTASICMVPQTHLLEGVLGPLPSPLPPAFHHGPSLATKISPLGNFLLCLIPKYKNIPDLKKGILWKCVSLRGALCQCKAESTIRKTKAFLSLVGKLAGRPHGCPPPPSLSLHVTLSPCESENWEVLFDRPFLFEVLKGGQISFPIGVMVDIFQRSSELHLQIQGSHENIFPFPPGCLAGSAH